jgi:hypothetical protein
MAIPFQHQYLSFQTRWKDVVLFSGDVVIDIRISSAALRMKCVKTDRLFLFHHPERVRIARQHEVMHPFVSKAPSGSRDDVIEL